MLVNKEIALGLKKIGFDEPVDYFYRRDGTSCRKFDKTSKNAEYTDAYSDWCDAPDKSDVFAWFRKKGIFGITHPMLCGKFYSYVYHDGETFVSPNPPHDEFETWEDAEDKCILKMIELCE